jgi:aldehyde:ferredoxin oxidoreductase
MGSKNLKAIVAYGNLTLEIKEKDKLDKYIKARSKEMVELSKPMGLYGTSNGVEYCEEVGELPIKNWSQRRFEGAKKISGQAMAKKILKGRYFCGSCIIGCGRVIEVTDGPYKTDGRVEGPEYETIGLMGSNLMVDDIEAIARFNTLCNMYGLDTISTGSVIGMIMECYEKKLIDKDFLDGIELEWGNIENIIKIIHKIGKREGCGRLLGEGTKKIAESIGPLSEEFAIQVKGLEAPAHEPRSKNSIALGYATSNRGACHLQAFTHDFDEGMPLEDIGYPVSLKRFKTEGKADLVVKFQHLMSMFDSLTCCKFVLFGGITVKSLVELLELVTGIQISIKEFLKIGERIFNLKRLYNVNCGISRKDDTLPPRYLTQKRGSGKYEDGLPNLGTMLDEYYNIRVWDETGIPTREKIHSLGLDKYLREH